MKNTTVLLVVLILLAGCQESQEKLAGPDESELTGGVAMTFRSASANKTSSSVELPDPTNVRVLVRSFDSDGQKFAVMPDVAVPSDTTVVISVPANSTYQIDAFSYRDSTITLRPLLKAAQVADVMVLPDEITNVPLVLEPILPTIEMPESVRQGENFRVAADFGNIFSVPRGRSDQYYVYLRSSDAYTDDMSPKWTGKGAGYQSGETVLNWDPVVVSDFGGQDAFFQITMMLRGAEFYRSDEERSSFAFNYPSLYLPDTIKTYVEVPDGKIGVDVTY